MARALEKQAKRAGQDDLSHAQLLETAQEVGLSPAEIEAAVGEVDRQRSHNQIMAQLQRQQRQGLRGHFAAYITVNLGLWGVDLATAGMGVNQQAGWHWIVAAAWGIGLAMHAWRTFNADPQSLSRAAARWQEKRARKLQQQQMQRAIEGAVTDAVTTGADALSRLLDPERQRERDVRRRERDRRP